ncbi:MAG TPA: hypothetical protein DCL44_00070 [Elusimicrobia bacterium]|nr:hypothetical protein [Elusimicrobiota bacterium]
MANSSDWSSLACGSCSSGRDFASGFLQIPPRDGHPCLWLTVGSISLRRELSSPSVWERLPANQVRWYHFVRASEIPAVTHRVAQLLHFAQQQVGPFLSAVLGSALGSTGRGKDIHDLFAREHREPADQHLPGLFAYLVQIAAAGVRHGVDGTGLRGMKPKHALGGIQPYRFRRPPFEIHPAVVKKPAPAKSHARILHVHDGLKALGRAGGRVLNHVLFGAGEGLVGGLIISVT